LFFDINMSAKMRITKNNSHFMTDSKTSLFTNVSLF